MAMKSVPRITIGSTRPAFALAMQESSAGNAAYSPAHKMDRTTVPRVDLSESSSILLKRELFSSELSLRNTRVPQPKSGQPQRHRGNL
jgi:hypothetical protein